MRYFYSAIFYLLIPFILVRLWWRSRKLPDYRQRIAERFAYFTIPEHFQEGIWVHGVSVGETLAAIPLIKRLKKDYPQLPIVVTTMTPTGSERVRSMLGDSVFHVYVPYDLPGVVKRFFNKVNPRLIVIMETEIWPNLLYYSRKNHVPTLLANARLSEHSAKGYALFGHITRRVLRRFDVIAAQAKADAERFEHLGMPREKIKVVGSIKFDIDLPPSIQEGGELLRQQLGAARNVWIAASTHEGEEPIVLKAFKIIKKTLPQSLLVLVPRHPERFDKVNSLCVNAGFNTARRSQGDSCSASTDVYLADTMGELMTFYAASDLAFVGGSLVPVGGHNLLEPAAFSLAILSGPNVFNFAAIQKLFEADNAVKIVNDETQLAEQVIHFLTDDHDRQEFGVRALQVVEANKGALEQHMRIIAEFLKS